jgi:hypothetical protein
MHRAGGALTQPIKAVGMNKLIPTQQQCFQL